MKQEPTSGAELLNAGQAAQVLGVSERKFHALRAAGLVSEPLCLGPRSLRWARSEMLSHLLQSAPRGGGEEPARLLRARIEKMKTGGAQ